ncbi:uncharacterized protein LOC105699898 isoform X2 [Orussus abietinus]|uniref:uncharacterized protein LOC105699898 isoform X2 n=1 Tax=Orussus abietinus TaxID=222816 RepID=UPI000626895B|nr:uncharacterized protein LOC105699898 isoform X2 [Orussus abietinus]
MKTTGRCWLQLALIFTSLLHIGAEKQKRQIFREQVLPSLGGKIPEEAFRTDRLALNRLNKDGIAIPDGVVLDARSVHKHHAVTSMPDQVIKVYLTPDGRYTPPEGRIHYDHPKTVDTTYIIRTPYSCDSDHKSVNDLPGHKPRITGYVKPQGYTSYQHFVHPVPSTKPQIHKPVISSLVLPATSENFSKVPFYSFWDFDYDWNNFYKTFEDYFSNKVTVFNSHQIISDYEGFLSDFHGRPLRHIDSKGGNKNLGKIPEDVRNGNGKSSSAPFQKYFKETSSLENFGHATKSSDYPDLMEIPKTNFSCRGRKGMYADVETKCQVFHDCSGWLKTSSLCPAGTAFSEIKKRCDWWNTVLCKE